MNLIYVGDAMCSWCYGFARPLDDLLGDPQDAAPLQLALLMGGLRPFTKEPMSPARADELAGHWLLVEETSGQPFARAPDTALHRRNFVYDTEPASRATVTVRSLWPQHVWRYFKAVQQAFYAEGPAMSRCPPSSATLPSNSRCRVRSSIAPSRRLQCARRPWRTSASRRPGASAASRRWWPSTAITCMWSAAALCRSARCARRWRRWPRRPHIERREGGRRVDASSVRR
jgi:hypothetical protein